MENSLRNAARAFLLGLLGLAALAAGSLAPDRIGETTRTILIALGAPLAVLSFFFMLMSLLQALGKARLRAGKGVIARWRVGAADWTRFRAFDAARSAECPGLINELAIPDLAPEAGIDVIVGRRQILVGRSYHALSGIPAVSALRWLSAPADPECLEFDLIYPAGRFGGVRRHRLLVPVPAAAREDGIRVWRHYQVRAPQPRAGLVFRRPGLVFGWSVAIALIAAGTAAAWMTCSASQCPDWAIILGIAGAATALGTLVVILALAAIVWRGRPNKAPGG